MRHRWKGKDKLISNILSGNPTHGLASVDQPAKTYISPVRTLNVIWRTYEEKWMIGTDGKRESENHVLSTQLDNDDDTYIKKTKKRQEMSHIEMRCKF